MDLLIPLIGTGKINNVHIKNSRMELNTTNNSTAGILVGDATGTEIINSSAENVQIISNNNNLVILGGLIGKAYSALISNCYAQEIYIEVNNANTSSGIGGLVGSSSAGSIKYSYTFGKIVTDKEYVGGICGQVINPASISNCYSGIDIEANAKYIAGIVGYNTNNSETSITHNLYIGNLYNSLEDITNIISGNDILGVENFGYTESIINGEKNDSKNITLLTKEEILDVATYVNLLFFDTQYEYTSLENNILPKLNYQNTDQVIPNQKDNILSSEIIEIDNIESRKINNTSAELRITLNNSENLEITNLEIDGMEIDISRNLNQNGKTYLDIIGNVTKFYDNYRISSIKYLKSDEEIEQELYGRIDIQFFKEINSYQDWQAIDENSRENYMLMADIDLGGKVDSKHNISVNRLITNGNMYTIKNLEINSDSGLIRDAKKEIRNIKFENITISSTSGSAYIGVIKNNTADLNNIEFNNIQINTNNSNYVACIAQNNGIVMNNITLNNVSCTGNSYVAGLSGYNHDEDFKNITGENITIKANSSYIGGIFGYIEIIDVYKANKIENITVIDSDIISNGTRVGGIIGYGKIGLNFKSIGNNVEGTSYVGGIIGQGSFSYANSNQLVDSCYAKGTSYVGGIAGNINNILDSTVKNTTVEGTSDYTGGIAGRVQNGCYGTSVIGVKIIGKRYVGGIEGYLIDASCYENYIIDSNIEGNEYVGGLIGLVVRGETYNNYVSANIEAIQYGAGGFVGYVQNQYAAGSNIQNIYSNYIANSKIEAESQVGGIIGVIDKELTSIEQHYNNFVEADLITENQEAISLGIGNMKNQNQYLQDTYYYKYSTINGENPNEQNEIFISSDKYLTGEELKQEETYTTKLKWSSSNWNFESLSNNKYPYINNTDLYEQEGIDLPIDEEHIVGNSLETQNIENTQNVEETFEYDNKTIETYSTYSVITAEDGSQVTRNAKLYVKDNSLYAVPTVLVSTSEDESIIPVADNLILDSYNGKEYETVLGSDGKLYDLKEPITYPENFVNENIESIGNNLNNDSHEVEVTYQNGDKVKFNYQTGEIISSSESDTSDGLGLFEYIKDKISELGTSSSNITDEISNKYEESKELQTKLEKTSVEEAIEKQNSSNSEQTENIGTATENNETNNSLKENKYISIYNEEAGEYEIYNEEELLDTSKEEVVSENEKIEANNLGKYYASEGEAKNTKMGIVWIVLSIIGVGIILFILGIRGRSLNPDKKR